MEYNTPYQANAAERSARYGVSITAKEAFMNDRIEILPDVFLTSVQTDKFKTGCFSINFLRPMARSEASRNALIPSVLLRGSEQYPDIRSISARLDELYGASVGTLVRKKGEMQLVGLFADFIEDALADEPVFATVLEFTAELLMHPKLEDGVFRADVVKSEKRNLANAIESRINNKRSYAVTQLLRLMCADEAYGVARLGELEDVERTDERDLFAHYQDVLAHSRVEIFYMGTRPAEQVREDFRTALRTLPRGETVPVSTQVVRAAAQVREKTETMEVAQGKLSLGFRTGCTTAEPEYPALLMMSTIFGGGPTSKLFTKVREEMSLCYYAGASIEKYKGVMLVSSGIETKNFETAKNEILDQLEQCRMGSISDYEFDSAKRYILSELKAAEDSPGRLDDYYVGCAAAGIDCPIGALAAGVEAVTMADVVDAAKRVTLDAVYFLKGAEA